MIAASKPLEFIPQGRQVVEQHASQYENYELSHAPMECALLHRMQNVNISDGNDKEFWCIREIYDDSCNDRKRYNKSKQQYTQNKKDNFVEQKQMPDSKNYMCEYLVNTEDELYFKNCTAVWTRGNPEDCNDLQSVCFDSDSNIKFAFFCQQSFTSSQASANKFDNEEEHQTSICIIDQASLHVYSSCGEDFLSNLEFPVSQVWKTQYGILLEKIASNTIIQNHTIFMPRVFSLAHPLDEICPLLHKSATNLTGYLIESDFVIIYSSEDSDLVLMYDNKISKHYIAKLRKATQEEINSVGTQNDTLTMQNSINRNGTNSFSFSSHKQSGATPKTSTTFLGRGSFVNSNYSNHISKLLSGANSSSPNTNQSRISTSSPLNNLHSTIGQSSITPHDMRKIGQAKPSKPIMPDLCLEHIWTENTYGNPRNYDEIATRAFIHTDIVQEKYFCYLLSRALKLQMIRIKNFGRKDMHISTIPVTVPARDAVTLERMKMMCVLAPCGTLMLYTGSTMVSKILISHPLTPSTSRNSEVSPPFPRRSSLLPNALRQPEISFDDELHLLSPVHPLQTQNSNINVNVCMKLRDPAGNRVTLVYPFDRMCRIALPLINETKLVSRCIIALRQILNKTDYVQLIILWYRIRNPPGSSDYTIEKEWEIFKDLILNSMGYMMSTNDSSNILNSSGMDEPKKRRRNSEVSTGTDEDWNFLDLFFGNSAYVASKPACALNSAAHLFPWIPAIFYGLHLVYEDLKLDVAMSNNVILLGEFLYQIASDLQLFNYTFHYAIEQSKLLFNQHLPLITQDTSKMYYKELLKLPIPNIYAQLENILKNRKSVQYDCVEGLNNLSHNVLQIISLIIHGHQYVEKWIKPLCFENSVHNRFSKRTKRYVSLHMPRAEQVVQMLINMDMTRNDIKRLPVAIHLIIAECLENVRISPPMGCSPATYELILRSELVEHTKLDWKISKMPKKKHNVEDSLSLRCPGPTTSNPPMEPNVEDGMEGIDTRLLCLRFPDDLRVAEVRRLLSSSEPVLIDIIQNAGVSDHDFIEEQEKQLYALCTRTMTLPVGRGMFTMRTLTPSSTESTPIPKLCLSGKEPTKGASIDMQQIEVPTNMNLWPTFHNGVAAGLKISTDARDIDSTWIVYNKPKGPTDSMTEHAGFLMALGLNGHLKTLTFMSVYDYLVKCDEMTNIGLLLGISATHRGTMNNTTTKLLSVHIEALLPATALELDITQNIQIASLMGIGLLYQGTAKRHIAEVLLQEVGRPPGPEMENCVERESYSLTAGLALGLVTLGQGESPAGLRDLQLPHTLHYYMVGGTKRPLTGSQKEKYKLPSFQVREGEHVNIDVTAPGATLALGLMFFNSNNYAIAEWMNPPNTKYLLDLVRPDLLLLRTISRNLIMWSKIEPNEKWLINQFPENLRFELDRNVGQTPDDGIDHEAITQAYCNIIAGSSFCMGLRYAGTSNPDAFKAIRRMIKQFMSFNTKYVGEFAGRTTVEDCLMVLLVSISIIFAGSGNLDVLRLVRHLRRRIGSQYPHVTYGSHMALHMSLGFLYLGAGRFTLSRTPEAIAALVCALFPKFPSHSNDNRYHLQAFRHLYVLAVEPRLFMPRDIDTKKLCLCKISVVDIDSDTSRELSMAPCMLPDLSSLKKVVVDDPNYWPVFFEKVRNWKQLINALDNSLCIDVKKRTGCLSHLEDPDGLKGLLSQTLTTEQYVCWEVDPKSLERFTGESVVTAFSDHFLHEDSDKMTTNEKINKNFLILLFYTSVVKDKMHVFPVYLGLFDILYRAQIQPKINDVWQIKLLNAYVQCKNWAPIAYSNELVSAHLQRFVTYIELSLYEFKNTLRKFLFAVNFDVNIIDGLTEIDLSRFLTLISYYNLTPNLFNSIDLGKRELSYFEYLTAFKKLHLDNSTIFSLIKIIKQNEDS